MAKDIAGTPRTVMIDGITFRLAADANLTEIFTNVENTMNATSGRAMRQITKRVPAIESIPLVTNIAERAVLKSFAETLDDLNMSVTNAAGDSRSCQGTIEVENNETEQNRTTIQILPREDWTDFAA